jgi:hypothetical protein
VDAVDHDRLSSPQPGEAALQEPALVVGRPELERPLVGGARLVVAPEPAQEVGASRVQVPVVLQREAVEEREPGLGTGGLRDRDGAVQLDDG